MRPWTVVLLRYCYCTRCTMSTQRYQGIYYRIAAFQSERRKNEADWRTKNAPNLVRSTADVVGASSLLQQQYRRQREFSCPGRKTLPSHLEVCPHRELLERPRVGQSLRDDLAGEMVDNTDEKLGHPGGSSFVPTSTVAVECVLPCCNPEMRAVQSSGLLGLAFSCSGRV